jgi:hypothetical protein
MTQLEEAAQAIDGVGRLALLDRSGGNGFGKDNGSAARSFLAYALILPAIALLIALQVAGADSDSPGLLTAALVIGYVIEIAGFPVLLVPLLRAYGRSDRWAWFVTGFNWFNATKFALLLAVLGLCVGPLQGLGIWPVRGVEIYTFVIEAFMAEALLDIGGMKAGSIVLLDALFSLAVESIAIWIGTGSLF